RAVVNISTVMEKMGNAISALQLEVKEAPWVALQNRVSLNYVLIAQERYRY
ncbi:hypothetical protein FQV21_0012212, partial [Spheniscus demersus]